MHKFPKKLISVVAAMVTTLNGSTIFACPNCRDGLSGNAAAIGIVCSIFLMMLMPFALGTAWFILIRLSRQRINESTKSISID